MINYAIIGTPQGYKASQWNALADNTVDAMQLADYIEHQLDIKTKLILPSKTAELFLFKTELLRNGKKLDSFILYRGADEINTTRPGSFYGAAIIVLDREFISIEAVITALRELADIVKVNCIKNNRFIGSLSLAVEALKIKPASIKKLSETSKQGINNQAIISDNYSTKFYLVDEFNVSLERAGINFYENIIKKYQQADLYFSSSECPTNLPVIRYPKSQETPQSKLKIPVTINLDNNDDNVLPTPKEKNLPFGKEPSTPHQPRQNTAAQSDNSTLALLALIFAVLSLLVSVGTLVIVLSGQIKATTSEAAKPPTANGGQTKTDTTSATPITSDGQTNTLVETTKSEPAQPPEDAAAQTKTDPASTTSTTPTARQTEPELYTVTYKDKLGTDMIIQDLCKTNKYECSKDKQKCKNELSKNYPKIKVGDQIEICLKRKQ
jgi:hypothetical protein